MDNVHRGANAPMPGLIEGIVLSDKISVPSQRTLTDAGQLIVPCAFARTGVQLYSAKSLGLQDEDPSSMIKVHRESFDVFDEASMNSFRSSPVTVGHPKDSEGNGITVTADNAKDIQVGMLEGMPVQDEELMTGTLVITNQEAIDSIEAGDQELSAGYTCDLELMDDKYYQRNIRANHIAIVAKGRAGSNCAIADEEEPIEEKPKKVTKKKPAAKKEETPVVEEKKPSLTDPSSLEPEPLISKAKATYTKHTVDHLISMMDEVSPELAAQAAQYVAEYEADETRRYADEAKWLEALAEAHSEISAVAVKIAKKKSKGMKDEADIEEAIHLVLDENTELRTQLDEMIDGDDARIESRINTILLAKEVTDLSDFKGMTELEIKKSVLDSAEIDYAERTDAYIEARFDVLCEDSDAETPMTKLQRKAVLDAKPEPYVNPVVVARQKMVDAQTQQHKGY